MESKKNFRRMVKQETGVDLSQIPIGDSQDFYGEIFCRRGSTYVVSFGDSDCYRDDGTEFWEPRPENFRVVKATAG